MFEFFFKYPPTVFHKGQLVFLARWPLWALAAVIVFAAALLAAVLWYRRRRNAPWFSVPRIAAIWVLQAAMAALLAMMLWHPALSVATLKPQQNIVAVVADDSRSMSTAEDGGKRIDAVRSTLEGGLLSSLGKKFQVRLYRFGQGLERIESSRQLTGSAEATHLSDALRQVAAEAGSLPIGAMVLLSDGADNSGGVDLETISEIRRRRIPVHTVGFGRERFAHDIEITEAVLPARTMSDSRVSAQVTLRQNGYGNRKARLQISEAGKVLATQEVALRDEGEPQMETVFFNAGGAGAKTLEVSVDALEGEENQRNNSLMRLVNVEALKPRVLYIEGEPRWELKFIRRAIEEDPSLQLVSMLRTTQNKVYRQGIASANELEEGFPTTPELLFGYQALILGNVEAAFFTPAQQELIRQFVDRRGGGLLFLGGRAALADGGYGASGLAELLPVSLPDRKGTFHRDPAKVALTQAGRDSLFCRLVEQPEKNAARWSELPALADYQEAGTPKPAALVLAESIVPARGRFPLLVTEPYGRGRTAVFATGGSWRWKMLLDHADRTHQTFWQQLARWLVADSPNMISVSTPRQMIFDESRVKLRAEARDQSFTPVSDARLEAHVVGPEGLSGNLELSPSPAEPGVYEGEWTAEKAGSYLVEVTATRGSDPVGRDVITFRRENGVAENFHAEQNRQLLEKLAADTGGRYYQPGGLSKLSDEVSYSEAGITTREMRDLWDMPAVFLLLILLRTAEWLLRRKWGAV